MIVENGTVDIRTRATGHKGGKSQVGPIVVRITDYDIGLSDGCHRKQERGCHHHQ